MAETTMAMADPAPAQKPMPVGFRFHPTEQECVGHYLRRKLEADDDLSINDTIPEIGVCKHEPWDLLALATSASGTKFDELQCYFFSPRDFKYHNSKRSNRATPRGCWKVTGRDRKIECKDTNKVIGIKTTLVYYEGRGPTAVKTNWFIHEYHDTQLSHVQRSHVLCWLRKDIKKKTTEKIHHLVDDETGTINHVMYEHENQANTCMNLEEHYCLNRSSIIQASSQPNEAIDSMIQMLLESSEAVDSIIQTSSQLNEVLTSSIHTLPLEAKSGIVVDLIVHTPSQLNEVLPSMIHSPPLEPNSTITVDSTVQIPFQQDETLASIIYAPPLELNSTIAVNSMIQTPLQPNETLEPKIDSMVQTPFQSNEVLTSIIQTPFQLEESLTPIIPTSSYEPYSTIVVDSMIKPPIKVDETLTSMIHIMPYEPNYNVETSFDTGEFDFTSLLQSYNVETSFDTGEFDFTSLLQSYNVETSFDTGEFDFTSLLQSPRMDEQELFEMMETSYKLWHEE